MANPFVCRSGDSTIIDGQSGCSGFSEGCQGPHLPQAQKVKDKGDISHLFHRFSKLYNDVPPHFHLKRMEELVSFLEIDEEKLGHIVHVAGTNGKGSTIHYLKNILMSQGYRVSTFTSPHLIIPNERIFLRNRFIHNEEFELYLARINNFPSFEKLHFFQIMTAIGFLAFQDHPVDYLLLETGLGGQYDMTNVLKKKSLCLFTPIQFDHMEQLGVTLSQIALNKLGIMRKGVDCLSAPQSPEVQKIFQDSAMDMEFISVKDPNPDDVAFCLAHRAAEKLLKRTIQAVKSSPLLGRFTTIRLAPTQMVILDVAHNKASMKALINKVKENFGKKNIKIIFGLQKSKDLESIVEILNTLSSHIIQLVPDSFFHPPSRNVQLHYQGFPSLSSMLSPSDEIIVICGSFQIVGAYLQDFSPRS